MPPRARGSGRRRAVTRAAAPHATEVLAGPGTVTVISGLTFAISDERGDLHGVHDGLIAGDVRHVSLLDLRIDGAPLEPLGAGVGTPDVVRFRAWVPRPGGGPDATLEVERTRRVSAGAMHEEIAVTSWEPAPVTIDVSLQADADFADIFEVRQPFAEPARAAASRHRGARADPAGGRRRDPGDGDRPGAAERPDRPCGPPLAGAARAGGAVAAGARRGRRGRRRGVGDGGPRARRSRRDRGQRAGGAGPRREAVARRPRPAHAPRPPGRAAHAARRRDPLVRGALRPRHAHLRDAGAGVPAVADAAHARRPRRPPGPRGRSRHGGAAREDPPRGALQRARLARRGHRPGGAALLRHRGRHAAVRDPGRRGPPLGRVPGRPPGAAARAHRRHGLDPRPRRPRRRRVHRVPRRAGPPPRQPGLEGLRTTRSSGRDGRFAEGPIALVEVQGYAYRARRELAAILEWCGDAPGAEALHVGGRRPARRDPRPLLDPGPGRRAGVVRARAGRGEAAGGRRRLQHGAPPVVRRPVQRGGRAGGAAPGVGRHGERVGAADALGRDGRLQPALVPPRLGVAPRHRVRDRRPAPVRPRRRGGAADRRPAGRPRGVRRAPARALRRASARRARRLPRAVPDGVPPPGVGGGRPARPGAAAPGAGALRAGGAGHA